MGCSVIAQCCNPSDARWRWAAGKRCTECSLRSSLPCIASPRFQLTRNSGSLPFLFSFYIRPSGCSRAPPAWSSRTTTAQSQTPPSAATATATLTQAAALATSGECEWWALAVPCWLQSQTPPSPATAMGSLTLASALATLGGCWAAPRGSALQLVGVLNIAADET